MDELGRALNVVNRKRKNGGFLEVAFSFFRNYKRDPTCTVRKVGYLGRIPQSLQKHSMKAYLTI